MLLCLLWLRKESVTYKVTNILCHLGFHWKFLMHAERLEWNSSCFVNQPNARLTGQYQDWVASAKLPNSNSPLQPEPVSSHHPVTFSLKDLFCLTGAACINLGNVKHVAAQQFTEGCDLLSLFHFSASSVPDVLVDTLVMFFSCIYHSQVSRKCYGDCSWFANQAAGLRLNLSSRDECKLGFNLSHRLQT